MNISARWLTFVLYLELLCKYNLLVSVNLMEFHCCHFLCLPFKMIVVSLYIKLLFPFKDKNMLIANCSVENNNRLVQCNARNKDAADNYTHTHTHTHTKTRTHIHTLIETNGVDDYCIQETCPSKQSAMVVKS